MPLGEKTKYKEEPFKLELADLIAKMIREEVDGIKAYEDLIATGQRIYPGGIKDAAVRNAVVNELKKILRDETNHVLMLRAIQNKLYE